MKKLIEILLVVGLIVGGASLAGASVVLAGDEPGIGGSLVDPEAYDA